MQDRATLYLVFDEASGHVLRPPNMELYAFDEYPDKPCEFKDWSAAKAWLLKCHGMENFQLISANSMEDQ